MQDLLGQVGDAAALHILQDLEKRGSEVRDPTGFLVSHAEKQLGNSSGGCCRGRRHAADSGPDAQGRREMPGDEDGLDADAGPVPNVVSATNALGPADIEAALPAGAASWGRAAALAIPSALPSSASC